jgi:hypothetical protein
MGSSIIAILNSSGKGWLAENLEWVVDNPLLQSHGHVRGKPVRHVQALRVATSNIPNAWLLRTMEEYKAPCFLFSDRKTGKMCWESSIEECSV